MWNKEHKELVSGHGFSNNQLIVFVKFKPSCFVTAVYITTVDATKKAY